MILQKTRRSPMTRKPRLQRLDTRIQRSKRSGRIVLGGVILVSLVFATVLIQGLVLALEGGRSDLVVRASAGLLVLAGLDVFSILLVRRQHRILNQARKEMETLVQGEVEG